jgi:hypothetical protein
VAAGENPATASTCAYGDDQFWRWDGVVRGLDSFCHVSGDRSRHQEHVGMFRGRYEMNAKSFQIVIGVRQGGDFCLATVARTGIELTNVQSPLQKTVNLPARNLRARSSNGKLYAAVDIPTPYRLLSCDTTPTESFCCDDGPLARFQAFSTTNAVPVGQREAGTTLFLGHAECGRRTNFGEFVSDHRGQAIRDNVGHAAAITVPKQHLDRNQSVWLAQALANHVTDHRSHPE